MFDEAMAGIDDMQADGLTPAAATAMGECMNIHKSLIAFAAVSALAACNQESHTIGGGPDEGETAATNGPVTLPPSISASKIYRCGDNRVIYVDWLSDNKAVNIRTDQGGTPTQATAAEPGGPFTAEGGYELKGTADAASVSIAVPGHASQSCKA
jgi:hypothetical protein